MRNIVIGVFVVIFSIYAVAFIQEFYVGWWVGPTLGLLVLSLLTSLMVLIHLVVNRLTSKNEDYD